MNESIMATLKHAPALIAIAIVAIIFVVYLMKRDKAMTEQHLANLDAQREHVSSVKAITERSHVEADKHLKMCQELQTEMHEVISVNSRALGKIESTIAKCPGINQE